MPEPEALTGLLYVYVIGHDEGPQKIGISNHPPTRAKALKVTGQPQYKVHFATLVPEADALGVERLAHWILRDAALGRERFDVSIAQAIQTVENAAARHAAGERAPPRDDLMSERVQLMVSASFVNDVEEWRKLQPGKLMTWSGALRRIVEERIAADRPRERTKPKPD